MPTDYPTSLKGVWKQMNLRITAEDTKQLNAWRKQVLARSRKSRRFPDVVFEEARRMARQASPLLPALEIVSAWLERMIRNPDPRWPKDWRTGARLARSALLRRFRDNPAYREIKLRGNKPAPRFLEHEKLIMRQVLKIYLEMVERVWIPDPMKRKGILRPRLVALFGEEVVPPEPLVCAYYADARFVTRQIVARSASIPEVILRAIRF